MIEPSEVLYSDTTGLYMWRCNYPEGQGDGYDISLGIMCPDHPRSVYFCVDAMVIWCDGGPPQWEVHTLDLLPGAPI
jgi:hypothetical protein